uniref:Uncharacterized protein n=1 Tax=Romanomermis culicivorax TaxID=13658 RepID=A0A915I939_ROMCU
LDAKLGRTPKWDRTPRPPFFYHSTYLFNYFLLYCGFHSFIFGGDGMANYFLFMSGMHKLGCLERDKNNRLTG